MRGQKLTFDLTLDKDELRIGLDETSLVEPVGKLDEGSYASQLNEMIGSDFDDGVSFSASSDPSQVDSTGSKDLRDGTWRPQQQLEREVAGMHYGLESYPEADDEVSSDRDTKGQSCGPSHDQSHTSFDNDPDGIGRAPVSSKEVMEGVGRDAKILSSEESDFEDEDSSDNNASSAMTILASYHMSMLNDRERTRRYRDGIHGMDYVVW